MIIDKYILELIESLQCFSGIGPKSAQRMAFFLLDNKDKANKLLFSLKQSIDNIQNCRSCRLPANQKICFICQDKSRDEKKICLVKAPFDIINIEKTKAYHGKYFILHKLLSPIDGVDGKSLGINILLERIKSNEINEIIIAIEPTPEGEMTTYYVEQQVKSLTEKIKITKLAKGIPSGTTMEYINSETIAWAIKNRVTL